MRNKNRSLVLLLFLLVGGMFGFSFALVPLYSVFCKITGLNGKVDLSHPGKFVQPARYASTNTQTKSHVVTIEFDVNRNQQAACDIAPSQPSLQVIPGQLTSTTYYVKNRSDRVLTIQAVPSISPGIVAQYLKKLDCFCFNRQVLQPYESMYLPLSFWLEPEFPASVHRMTLSYTVFDVSDL